MILFSIITCTYNSEKYLEQCLKSVLCQNIDPKIYEHIIIDGGSHDKTAEYIKEYTEKSHCENIKVITLEPKGVYNACNIGISNARGEYVCFLNSDDYFYDGALDAYKCNILNNKSVDIFYGNVGFLKGSTINYTNIKRLLFFRYLLAYIGFHTLLLFPAVIIKKNSLMTVGVFDEKKRISSDFGLWLKVFKNSLKLKFIDHTIEVFRVHNNSLSSGKYQKLGIIEMKEIRKEILGLRGNIINMISDLLYKITGLYF